MKVATVIIDSKLFETTHLCATDYLSDGEFNKQRLKGRKCPLQHQHIFIYFSDSITKYHILQ